MFAYCNNNPITMVDSSGKVPVTGTIAIGIIVGFGIYIAALVIERSGANDAEKRLIYQDPIAAYQVYLARELTDDYVNKYYGLENEQDGNQVNAFRHAMWNAIMTDKIGAEKTKVFADAHEQIPNNPADHMQMDLHNNELGRNIATLYAGQGYDVFAGKIIEAISNGQAEVLTWDTNV